MGGSKLVVMYSCEGVDLVVDVQVLEVDVVAYLTGKIEEAEGTVSGHCCRG